MDLYALEQRVCEHRAAGRLHVVAFTSRLVENLIPHACLRVGVVREGFPELPEYVDEFVAAFGSFRNERQRLDDGHAVPSESASPCVC